MLGFHAIAIAVLVAAQVAAAPRPPADSAPLFVLVRGPSGFAVRIDSIGPDQTMAYRRGGHSEVVDVLLPVGPGRSGNLVPLGDETALVVRRTGDSLRLEARAGDRVTRLPPRALADLRGEDVRLNVVAGAVRAAFTVRGWATAERDTLGPVEDLFAGRLPAALLGNATVITTDTRRRAAGTPARGSAALTIDRYARVGAAVDGRATEMIVDLGCVQTVVTRALVPPGTPIDPSVMVEYSAAGRRELDSAPQGATGPIRTLGEARLDSLRIGDIVFRDVPVVVVESLLSGLGPGVGGVLGIDLLRRGRLTLELAGAGPRRLTLSDPAEPRGRGGYRVPFTIVHELICVRGDAGGRPVHFLVDTGAPVTFVDSTSAAVLGLASSIGSIEVKGVGGQGAAARTGRLGPLRIGAWEVGDVPCRIASLSVLATLRGGDQAVGLLGLATLAQARRIDFDFESCAMEVTP